MIKLGTQLITWRSCGRQLDVGALCGNGDVDRPDEEYVGGCPTGLLRGNQIINEGILRQPVGRILFCGTETATSWRGYMEGAVESAERVASEVAARFDDNSAPLPADQHSKIYDTSSPVVGFHSF